MIHESAASTRIRVCRVCGDEAISRATGRVVRDYPLVTCVSCGVLHVEQRPSPEELKELYDRLFAEGEYEIHRREFESLKAGRSLPNFERPRLLRRVGKMVRGRRLIEIGGGTGKFGLDARHHGWEYVNYDISKTAVEFCRQLDLDARVFLPTGPPPLDPGSADLVVMWEVLEHVWNVKEYLDMIRGALRPGGALLLSTPNYNTPALRDRNDWGQLSAPPIHLTFFTPPTLERALRAGGFDQIDVSLRRLYRPEWRSPASWIRSLRFALLLDEPETLYAIVH